MLKLFNLLLIALLLSSCAQMRLKKVCSQSDWSKYVKNSTLLGEDYKQSSLYQACQKAEFKFDQDSMDRVYKNQLSNYCQKDHVTEIGKKGLFYKFELCPSLNKQELLPFHAIGVKEFCNVNNAFAAGKSGVSYNNICPSETLKQFIAEFDRGRREHLSDAIAKLQRKIDEIDYSLERSYSERSYSYNKLMLRGNYYSSYLNYVNQRAGYLNSNNRSHRYDSYRHRMFSIDNDIRVLQFYKRDLRLKIEKLNQELRKANGLVKKPLTGPVK